MINAIYKLILISVFGFASFSTQALPPSSSEYVTDPQTVYNNDDTTETFNLIKIVACFIKNNKPELQAGKGKYVAWVGSNTCEDSSETTGDEKRFEKALIESGSNSQGQLTVRFWLEGQNDNTNNGVTTWTTKYYFVNVNIAAGVNIAPPLGNWTIHFCQVAAPSSTDCESLGFGQITPSNIRVFQKEVWNDGTLMTRQGSINYVLSNGEIQTGKGSIQLSEDASKSTQNNLSRELYTRFAFKDGYYLSRPYGQTNNICYDRSAENGYENVWETWLYNPIDGKRINHNSGMSIKKSTTDNSNDNRGWASYWGVWFPEDKKPTVGSTIYADVSGQTNKPYKYMKTVGTVYKNIIKKGPLADITDVPLTVSLPVSTSGIYGANQTKKNVRIKWTASSTFEVLAVNGTTITGNPPTLSFNQLLEGNSISNGWITGQYSYYNSSLNLNQEGTSNWYEITLGDGNGSNIAAANSGKQAGCVWSNNTYECNVVLRTAAASTYMLRSQFRVLPGTTDALALANKGNLKCTGNCYKSDGTQDNGPVKVTDAPTYKYNSNTGVMSIVSGSNSTAIAKPAGDQWSGDTEPLIAATDTSNLNAAICQNWDSSTNQNANFYCGWNLKQGNSSFTYFSYQINSQSWSDSEYLFDESSQTPLFFDQPISTRYTVNQSKSPLNGQEVGIQYQGNGQLNLPGHCYSRAQDKTVDCSGGWNNDKFYINDFIVPPWTKSLNDYVADGTAQAKTPQATLTNIEDSNKTYLTKWMRKGVIFRTVANGANTCSGLSIPAPGEITLPGLPDWSNPALSSSPTYIGPWQSPSGNPLYVDGVLQ